MYAVIKTGGKQYKVATGDVLEVERLRVRGDKNTLTLTPLLVVTDQGKAIHGAGDLAGYRVGVKVVGEAKGEKLTVFKYRPKSGYSSKTGHRQLYSLIEITSIGSENDSPTLTQDRPAKAGRAGSQGAGVAGSAAAKSGENGKELSGGEPAASGPDAQPATLKIDGS